MQHTRKEQMEAFGRFLEHTRRTACEMSLGQEADQRKPASQYH